MKIRADKRGVGTLSSSALPLFVRTKRGRADEDKLRAAIEFERRSANVGGQNLFVTSRVVCPDKKRTAQFSRSEEELRK